MNAVQEGARQWQGQPVSTRFRASKCRGVRAAARFLGVSPALVYAYVERKQIPRFRIMGRAIRFSISELEKWRHQFFVNGGIDEQQGQATQD